MRGGIIVKFNLEFPYDADIDKIRKVITKVRKAMLEDEELGKDFIKPVKSHPRASGKSPTPSWSSG
jgi:small-conductance mechanosensitive channel